MKPKKQKTLLAGSTNGEGVLPPPKSTAKSSSKSNSSNSSAAGTTTKKSEAAAKAMKSNSYLLKIMADEVDSNDSKIWTSILSKDTPTHPQFTTTTPYSALCDVFTEIESISGRLDIQEKLTTLFRKVLLKDGGGDSSSCSSRSGGGGGDDQKEEDTLENGETKKKDAAIAAAAAAADGRASDLYTLLYLTSNTVAPQHANVELGVGDGILIKAIGEASGSAPNMVKKKYEKEGDLGNVAMNAKGRQRTLVGFGKASNIGGGSGPKRLSCVDVLKVFKEIVSMANEIKSLALMIDYMAV